MQESMKMLALHKSKMALDRTIVSIIELMRAVAVCLIGFLLTTYTAVVALASYKFANSGEPLQAIVMFVLFFAMLGITVSSINMFAGAN